MFNRYVPSQPKEHYLCIVTGTLAVFLNGFYLIQCAFHHQKTMERESDETQQQQVRSLCRMGCGFYGSSSTDGMCSKCFKDSIRRKQSSPATGTVTPSQGVS